MKFANSVVVVCLVVIVALTLFLFGLMKSEILPLSFPSSNAYAQRSLAVQNKQQQHPNIVLFLVDNEPNKALGTYDGLGAQTPNADKFAKEGIKFTRAYATNTYCSPTRV